MLAVRNSGRPIVLYGFFTHYNLVGTWLRSRSMISNNAAEDGVVLTWKELTLFTQNCAGTLIILGCIFGKVTSRGQNQTNLLNFIFLIAFYSCCHWTFDLGNCITTIVRTFQTRSIIHQRNSYQFDIINA